MPRAETTPNDKTTAMLARLWRDWLRPYRSQLGLVLLLVFVFAGVNSLYPEIIRRSVDALKLGDTEAIGWITPLIVGATFLKGAALYAQKIVTNHVLTRVEYDMQSALYHHLVDADVAALAREAPASFAARFTADIGLVSRTLEKLVATALRDLMMVVGLVGALFYIDWELSLYALAVFPIAILPVARIGKMLRKLAKRTNERVSAMAARVTESFAGVRVAKTYGLESYLKENADEDFGAIRDLKRRRVRHQALIDPLMEVLGGVAVAAVIWLIGARIAAGTNTLGDVSGFVAALLLAAQPMRALGNLNAQVQTGMAGAKRLYDLLDARPTVAEAPDAITLDGAGGALALDHVTFRYEDGSTALDDVSLTVAAGARVALVGRSGAGKSTIFHLLPRLYDVSEGAIRIGEADIRDVTLASLRNSIALVGQEAVLFNDTVLGNIALGREGATRDEIEAAARAAAAHDFIMALPEGYDTPVGERGERLSGGQRQRLSIARAFLRDAPILLLDEATSALDAESETAIRGALDALSEGRTTLIIAHRLSTILDADVIAVLDRGRLVEIGSHAELLEADGLYARLYTLQFAGVEPAAS